MLICGQALSHCVNYTTRDIIDHWDKSPASLVLLTDGNEPASHHLLVLIDRHYHKRNSSSVFILLTATSPVAGFEVEGEEFKRHCESKGLTLNTIADAFASCKPKPPQPQQK